MPNWMDTLKVALDLAKRINNIDLQKAMIDLQDQLLQSSQTQIAMLEENQKLKQQLRETTEQLEMRGRVVYEKNCVWLQATQVDGGLDGPFCHHCYEDSHSLRKMMRFEGRHAIGCSVCGRALFESGDPLLPDIYKFIAPSLRGDSPQMGLRRK